MVAVQSKGGNKIFCLQLQNLHSSVSASSVSVPDPKNFLSTDSVKGPGYATGFTALADLLNQPEVTSINRLPGRATFGHYSTLAQARRRSRTHRWELTLDGMWEFRLAKTPAEALARLDSAGEWDEQVVPGHWVLQGYGHPHYTNVQLPFPEDPPHPPVANPTGIYRRTFEVPEGWEGMRVVVRFGSADSALLLFVNGEFVGLSKDSRVAAEFDLTNRLRAEGNEIIAVVSKWSDATFIEDQDMWWLPGLARSVALYATPRVFLADVKVEAGVERSGDGQLRVQAEVGYADVPVAGSEVEVQLLDAAGEVVFKQPLRAEIKGANEPVMIDRNIGFVEANVPRGGLKLWSAETPNLYTVVVTLRGAKRVSHVAVRVGFRRIEIVGRDFLLNGQRVLVAGVNRHEFHPRRGRALTEVDMLADLILMKRYHFNAVRASHYPPDERWLDLCDEHGLMVVDEANIEAHHHHNQVCKDPRYAAAFVDRVSRMVLRDKNHPSILWWSMGNESGYGPNHDAAAGWVRHYDTTRPLFYEGAISVKQSRSTFAHGALATDIICPMYTAIDDLRKWADYVTEAGVAEDDFEGRKVLAEVEALNPDLTTPLPRHPLKRLPDPRNRPVILCEYSHAMGNSNGSLSDYFELFRTVPGMQGGFIWEWCDHAFWQKMADGSERLAYGGDFGDTPHDANFCCDGLVSSDREPHPAMEEHRKLAQPIHVEAVELARGKVRVHNRQNFRSLAWLSCDYTWEVDGQVVREGHVAKLATPAGESTEVTVPVPVARLIKGGTELALTLVYRSRESSSCSPEGTEIAWEQLVQAIKPISAKSVTTEQRAEWVEAGDDWVISHGGETTSRIDRSAGAWHTLERDGQNLFAGVPQLSLWRAPTDNDGIKLWDGQEDKALGRWRKFGIDQLARKVESVKLARQGESVIVVTKVALSGRENWTDFVATEHFVFGPNAVRLELDLAIGDRALWDLPRIGFLLPLAARFDEVEWYGPGPDECYCDRMAATRLGRWESSVEAMEVPYVMPQENGHREAARWVQLGDGYERTLCFRGKENFGFNVSRHHPDDLYRAKHREELIVRPETLLHLDGFHRGIGTGSCGPDTLAQYCWAAGGARFSFEMEVR